MVELAPSVKTTEYFEKGVDNYQHSLNVHSKVLNSMYSCNFNIDTDMDFHSFMQERFGFQDITIKKMLKFNIVKKTELFANPFLANLQLNPIGFFNVGLQSVCLHRYALEVADEISLNLRTMKSRLSVYCMDETCHVPSLYQYHDYSRYCWITINPIEINSMRSMICKASGNIVLLGCGIGYLAYMLACKNNVSQITIVDNEPNILSLFEEFILPQFKHKIKIRLVCEDAIEYLKHSSLKDVDYCLVDMWHSLKDMGHLYWEIRKLECKYHSTTFMYWFEQSMKNQIYTKMFLHLSNQFGFSDIALQHDSLNESIESLIASTRITLQCPNDIIFFLQDTPYNLLRFI